jgi:hypothetical protein
MVSSTRGTSVQSGLLDLLEYRVVLGALITTLDGLLVASAAINVEDAELIAASIAVREETEGQGSPYWEASSEHGALRVVSGADMRLIVLSESNVAAATIQPIMAGHLRDLEETMRI